ncbi:MAG: polysaccharide deacetylase family protein [Pseudomonadota bacterium]
MRAIITFHSIDDSGSVISFPPDRFAHLLDGLRQSALPVTDLDTLLSSTDPGLAITFDDGMKSVIDHALPLLHGHGMPAHLFLTTGAVGKSNRWATQPEGTPTLEMMSWDDLARCQEGGIAIESHTENHPDLRALSGTALREECERADQEISTRTGRHPQYFAYPYGLYNTSVITSLHGRYRASMTTLLNELPAKPDLARVPRIDAYYLRDFCYRASLDSLQTRSYLQLRRALRAIKRFANL